MMNSCETAKTALGLDHNETRPWHGWHRHVSLVMLAFALMSAIRHKADGVIAVKKELKAKALNSSMIRWSVQGNPPRRLSPGEATYQRRPRRREGRSGEEHQGVARASHIKHETQL